MPHVKRNERGKHGKLDKFLFDFIPAEKKLRDGNDIYFFCFHAATTINSFFIHSFFSSSWCRLFKELKHETKFVNSLTMENHLSENKSI